MKGGNTDMDVLETIGEDSSVISQATGHKAQRNQLHANDIGSDLERSIELLTYQQYLEYGLVYFWILKDYAWAANAYYMGVIFGTTAVVWAVCLMLFSFYRRDYEDAYVNFVMTLWLGGNYIWMSGELTKDALGLGIPYWGNNTQNTEIALICFIAALSLMTIFFLVLKPWEILPQDRANSELEIREDLRPRFPSYFKTLRQYEYLHIFFWVGKDMCWNLLSPIPWSIFFFFTFAVALDFLYITYDKKPEKFAHVAAQFFWVLANFAWGCGEQFNAAKDSPTPIGVHNALALNTGRWWAEVILVIAYQPLALFYVWLFYSWMHPDPNSKSALVRKMSMSSLSLGNANSFRVSNVGNPLQGRASMQQGSSLRASDLGKSTISRNSSDEEGRASIALTNQPLRATSDSMNFSLGRGPGPAPGPRNLQRDTMSLSVQKEGEANGAVQVRKKGTSFAAAASHSEHAAMGIGSDAVKLRTSMLLPKSEDNL